MGALSVVDVVELVDLGLELPQGGGQWLLVELPEQGLVETFVLSLGGGLVGLAGDRLDAQGLEVDDQSTQDPASGGVERDAVVGQESLRHAVANVGGQGEAGVVVDELEDHALATTRQDVLGGVELPARVRGRVDEPAPRGAGFLLRFSPGDARGAEDPGQRCDRWHRGHVQGGHLVVDADRAVVQAGGLQGCAYAEACCSISLVIWVGDVRGRRERGSNAAAWPSVLAWARIA